MYRNIIYLMLIVAIISSISFAHHAGTSYHGNITGCGQYNASGYWYVNESFNWSGASIGSCLTMANNTDSATIIDGGRFDITQTSRNVASHRFLINNLTSQVNNAIVLENFSFVNISTQIAEEREIVLNNVDIRSIIVPELTMTLNTYDQLAASQRLNATMNISNLTIRNSDVLRLTLWSSSAQNTRMINSKFDLINFSNITIAGTDQLVFTEGNTRNCGAINVSISNVIFENIQGLRDYNASIFTVCDGMDLFNVSIENITTTNSSQTVLFDVNFSGAVMNLSDVNITNVNMSFMAVASEQQNYVSMSRVILSQFPSFGYIQGNISNVTLVYSSTHNITIVSADFVNRTQLQNVSANNTFATPTRYNNLSWYLNLTSYSGTGAIRNLNISYIYTPEGNPEEIIELLNTSIDSSWVTNNTISRSTENNYINVTYLQDSFYGLFVNPSVCLSNTLDQIIHNANDTGALNVLDTTLTVSATARINNTCTQSANNTRFYFNESELNTSGLTTAQTYNPILNFSGLGNFTNVSLTYNITIAVISETFGILTNFVYLNNVIYNITTNYTQNVTNVTVALPIPSAMDDVQLYRCYYEPIDCSSTSANWSASISYRTNDTHINISDATLRSMFFDISYTTSASADPGGNPRGGGGGDVDLPPPEEPPPPPIEEPAISLPDEEITPTDEGFFALGDADRPVIADAIDEATENLPILGGTGIESSVSACRVRKVGPAEMFLCEYEGFLGLIFFDGPSFGLFLLLMLLMFFILISDRVRVALKRRETAKFIPYLAFVLLMVMVIGMATFVLMVADNIIFVKIATTALEGI